jgi:predicted ATPase
MHLRHVELLPEHYPTRNKYPFNLPIFHQTKQVAFDTPVTFFAGENGSGKTTLLRAIARKCGINTWDGAPAARFEHNRYEDMLHRTIDLHWANGSVPGSFFSSQRFQNLARNLDEWAVSDPGMLKYFGGASLITQSHGQSLMSFFRARYRIEGLFLMDEPETALSPKTQLELLRLLREMSQAGHAQFIIASHSPILLACPDARILSFDQAPVATIDYEDTDYYRVYRDFMDDRGKYLAER